MTRSEKFYALSDQLDQIKKRLRELTEEVDPYLDPVPTDDLESAQFDIGCAIDCILTTADILAGYEEEA